MNFWDAATEDDGSCIYMNESTLPLVQVTTDTPILDDPRIVANMKVTNLESGFNSLSDTTYEYNGQITIEIRGSSSQFFPSSPTRWKPRIPLGPTTTCRFWACRRRTIGFFTGRIRTRP